MGPKRASNITKNDHSLWHSFKLGGLPVEAFLVAIGEAFASESQTASPRLHQAPGRGYGFGMPSI